MMLGDFYLHFCVLVFSNFLVLWESIGNQFLSAYLSTLLFWDSLWMGFFWASQNYWSPKMCMANVIIISWHHRILIQFITNSINFWVRSNSPDLKRTCQAVPKTCFPQNQLHGFWAAEMIQCNDFVWKQEDRNRGLWRKIKLYKDAHLWDDFLTIPGAVFCVFSP